jgi:hypothetical protein
VLLIINVGIGFATQSTCSQVVCDCLIAYVFTHNCACVSGVVIARLPTALRRCQAGMRTPTYPRFWAHCV